jgi:hypothetical protein
MHNQMSYRILAKGFTLGLSFALWAGIAGAQQAPRTTPTDADMYCSGVVDTKPVPGDSYVISGENSSYKTSFYSGDYVYINRGGENGVKVGDQFEVVRPIEDDSASTIWFKYQPALSKAMGTNYADIGRLRVIHVDAKTSTAETSLGCGYVLRGDLVRPFVPRPTPSFHTISLDPFAPPSGKKTAMVVYSRDYAVLAGPGRVVYVNLGNAQGVHVGDYFRVFRYQGTHIEANYQLKEMSYKAYGFGSAPLAYEWNNLPRQILGEGIVLRTGTNSSTVLLTNVRFEIYAGDYVELE